MMSKTLESISIAAAIAIALIQPVKAGNIQSFTITESYTGGTATFHFSIDETPFYSDSNQAEYNVTSESVSYTGTNLGYEPAYPAYYQYPTYSYLFAYSPNSYNNYSSVYFNGPNNLGTLSLAGAQDAGSSYILQDGTTTSIGGGTVTVPEPATWAMLLFGFAGLGLAGHRARRASSIAA